MNIHPLEVVLILGDGSMNANQIHWALEKKFPEAITEDINKGMQDAIARELVYVEEDGSFFADTRDKEEHETEPPVVVKVKTELTAEDIAYGLNWGDRAQFLEEMLSVCSDFDVDKRIFTFLVAKMLGHAQDPHTPDDMLFEIADLFKNNFEKYRQVFTTSSKRG